MYKDFETIQELVAALKKDAEAYAGLDTSIHNRTMEFLFRDISQALSIIDRRLSALEDTPNTEKDG